MLVCTNIREHADNKLYTYCELAVMCLLFPLPGVLELRKRRGVQYGAVAVSALLGLTLARLRRRKSIVSKFYRLGRDRILGSDWGLNILMLHLYTYVH